MARMTHIERAWWGVLFIALQSSHFAQGQSCTGVETFDKVTAMTLSNSNRTPLYSSIGNTVTAECNNRCRASVDCPAYMIDYNQEACYRLDTNSDNNRHLITPTDKRINYFEKVCLNAPACEKAWIYERVVGFLVEGFDNRVVGSVGSRVGCQELCLLETEFQCLSAEYVYSRQECRLSSESRRSQPASYRPTTEKIDYLENQCRRVKNPGNCQYDQFTNQDIGFSDIQVTGRTQSECADQCDQTSAFNCRSFTYFPGTSVCRLSGDDNISAGPQAVLIRQGADYYQHSPCLDSCSNEEGCHLPSICDNKPCHPSALCSSISSGFKCLCQEGDVGDPYETGCLASSRFREVVSPTTLGLCGYKPDSFATTHVQCGSSISASNAPWQVSIFQNILGKNWCGGLLISDRHILTSAHCFESGECWRYDNNRCEKGDFRVFFGRTNGTIIQPNGVILDDVNSAVRRIEEVYVHPMWQYANRLSGGHDIALITVRRLSITPFIKPACLPNPLTHFFLNRNNEKIEFSGFGKNDSDDTTTSNIPHQLQLAQMKIIEKPICDSKLGGDVSPDIFCTIPANADDDDCSFKPGSCKGDSGGPGVVKDPYGQYVAVGIVSGGPPCGEDEPSLPHYMTSVSHHLSFILDHMEEPPCPPPLGAATPPSCNKKFVELVSDIQCYSKRDCPEGARCLDNFCTSYEDDAQARLARTDCSSPQECLNGAFQCDDNIKKCRPDKSTTGIVVHVAGGRGVLSVPSLSSQGILSQTLSSVRSSCWGYKSCAVRTTDERTVCESPICTHSRCWCPYPPSLYLDLSTYKFVDKE